MFLQTLDDGWSPETQKLLIKCKPIQTIAPYKYTYMKLLTERQSKYMSYKLTTQQKCQPVHIKMSVEATKHVKNLRGR
jgi:hypothetical protein